MSVAYSLDNHSYGVRCAACSLDYDAMTAMWCRCVAKDFSSSCPRCGTCVCHEGPAALLQFWHGAPSELRRRRDEERQRRAGIAAVQKCAATKVMVVDDDEEIRLMAEFSLNEMGYRTVSASRAAEALAMIQKEKPDVVLTDALMPGGDGRELCRTIKLRHPKVKVVIMTSLYTSPRYASEAYRVFHADGYLAKPIDFERLRAVLGRLA